MKLYQSYQSPFATRVRMQIYAKGLEGQMRELEAKLREALLWVPNVPHDSVPVGEDAAVLKHKGPKTRVIDARGRMVLPGLFDSHVHPVDAVTTELANPPPVTVARPWL